METRSTNSGLGYLVIQVLTVVGGGSLCLALGLFSYSDYGPQRQLLWGLVQSLRFLSGLGFVAAMLSFVLPALGRPILRGYYAFFFTLYIVAVAFSIPGYFQNTPADALATLPIHLFIFAGLTTVLKLLAPPKKKEEAFAET